MVQMYIDSVEPVLNLIIPIKNICNDYKTT